MFNLTPCQTCGCAGGGPAGILLDPENGPIGSRRPIVCIAGVTLGDWLRKFEGTEFGTHLDPWLRWMRRSGRAKPTTHP